MDISKKYKITTVDTKSISELDFELYGQLWEDWDGEEITKNNLLENKRDYYADGYPLSIKRLIQILHNFSGKGATHVAIQDNCDHIGYELEAIQIEESCKNLSF